MKEIITDFPKTRAKNAQHVLFVQDVLAAVPEATATTYGFGKQRAAFAAAAGDEVACFKPDKGYLDTPKIEKADKDRDNAFYLYKGMAGLYESFGITEEEREAGRVLSFAFRETGVAAEMDYASETATLVDLVAKLRVEPYVSALATLGMSAAPDKLEELNEAFHDVYKLRTVEERDRALSKGSMKTLRPATDQAFDALAKAINAIYAVNELVTNDEETREALGALIDDVNAVVVRFRKVVSGSASGTTTTTETPDPENPSGGEGEPTDPNPDGGGGEEVESPDVI